MNFIKISMLGRKVILFLIIAILTLTEISRAQTSFLKINLPSQGYVVNIVPDPYLFISDSAVFINVFDDLNVKITVHDTVGKHKDFSFNIKIEPFTINYVTLTEQSKRRLKLLDNKREYYMPAKRCHGYTPLAKVERSIVDMMLIDHIGARMREAKKFVRTHCLTYRQLKGIVMMFPSDKDRLTIAKYSYFFVRDYYNYFLLRDAFSSKNTYKQFETFVKGVHRDFKF